jgi:hypothetical protein
MTITTMLLLMMKKTTKTAKTTVWQRQLAVLVVAREGNECGSGRG